LLVTDFCLAECDFYCSAVARCDVLFSVGGLQQALDLTLQSSALLD